MNMHVIATLILSFFNLRGSLNIDSSIIGLITATTKNVYCPYNRKRFLGLALFTGSSTPALFNIYENTPMSMDIKIIVKK
jgi:hypothetical protein